MISSVLILDFGSQVTQLIARRVRESGVFCEVHPFNCAKTVPDSLNLKGIILSGSPESVVTGQGPRIPNWVFDLNIPVLGICYGQQIMCSQLGGRVSNSGKREFGRAQLEIIGDCELFSGTWRRGTSHQVWMSHGDKVEALPDGFKVFAVSENAPFAVIGNTRQNLYGVQFHPEVVHTPDGKDLLRNFTHKICGCAGDWTMASFLSEAIRRIQNQVGSRNVICGLSGGVDSTVTAVLIHRAIGDQLRCVFVDHGLMRKGETEYVINLFREHYNIPLVHKDAKSLFIGNLRGITDPEKKRRIIGSTFIDVFEEQANKIGSVEILAQGTLYPDVIESVSIAGGKNVTIKSHHNVGGLPDRMNLELLDPLRELFKDEVRLLGRELGLPDTMLGRHPFPGPGLAIRIPGEVSDEKANILREADDIYLDEIRKAGLYDKIWQAFAVLLPVRTVGVMGDSRSYDYACALRAVTSTDGMTADYYPFDHRFLARVSSRIINEVKGINRVTYDITSKPPGTIEWE